MKKLIALILVLTIITPALISCKKEVTYDPIPSTEEEARVVMTLQYNGKTYDVKYELYRALFLNLKDEVSGGDDSVWTGEHKDEYIEEINSLIKKRIAHVYSVFALCDELGINLYTESMDDRIAKYVKESVEGSDNLRGYGSYSAYLQALKEMNLNYSAQDLLLRYSIGLESIETRYIGGFNPEAIKDKIIFGDRVFTKDDILAYYNSDKCIRTLRAEINYDAHYEPDARAAMIRQNMADAASSGEEAVAIVIIGSSATAASEVENGYVMGRYSLERLYFEELIDASFSLGIGEVSEPITIHNDTEKIIYIVYRAGKSMDHFENNYSDIVSVFLSDSIGEILYGVEEKMQETITVTDAYNEIVHSEISMG